MFLNLFKMQKLDILNSKQRKELAQILNKQFGCKFEFDYEVFVNRHNKIFLLNKDIKKINMDDLRINSLGLYFGHIYDNNEFRLSIEGSQIIGKIAKKNVLKLNDEQADLWMEGQDTKVETDVEGFVIIKNKGDFLGCGKLKNKKLLNYVPKERRA